MKMKEWTKKGLELFINTVAFALMMVIALSLVEGSAHATGTVSAGFDPTATTTSAIGTVSTFLGVLIPIVLGIAVIFWMVRKGIAMFKGGSKLVAFGLVPAGLLLAQGHASAATFATFAAGYDPTTNFTDAIGLVATYLGVIVPLSLGVAVIFWMIRKGIAMFKGGSK